MTNEEEKFEEDIKKEDLNEEEAAEDVKEAEVVDEELAETEAVDAESSQIEELNKQILRITADYENFKRRTKEEKVQLLRFGNEKLLIDILAVLDNFERAIDVPKASEEIKKFIEGMDMIYRQLLDVLTKAGLSKIDALGKQFDPELHDAVMMVEDENVEDNTIIADLRTGYLYHDKVIRPSMVQVAKNN